MSSSGFPTASEDLAEARTRIEDATAALGNLEFPGEGVTAERFNVWRDALKTKGEGMYGWADTAKGKCDTQAEIDRALEQHPTPEYLEELAKKAKASGDPDDAEAFNVEAEARRLLETQHEGSTGKTCFPPPTGSSDSSGSIMGDLGDGTGGGLGDLGGEVTGEDPDAAPVAEDTPESPRAPTGSGATDTPTPSAAPVADNAVSTETSADTALSATGAGAGALSQPAATPGGAPITGTGGQPNASYGSTGGAPGQLGQPQQQQARGVPKSHDNKRGDDNKPATPDNTPTQDGTGAVPVAGVVGAAGSAGTPSSPTTNTTGAQGVTPTATNAAAGNTNAAANGTGAGGMAGAPRAMGSGNSVHNSVTPPPTVSTAPPDWLDDLLGGTDDDDDTEEPKP